MKSVLLHLEEEALGKLSSLDSDSGLEEHMKEYLGKSGKLTDVLKGIKDLSDEEKKEIGSEANRIRDVLSKAFEEKKLEIAKKVVATRIESEWMDVTLPGKRMDAYAQRGGLNPFSAFQRECEEIFKKMGFTVWDGPHIVSDYDNFGSLNFPDHHPARDMQDNFFLDHGFLLRAHTSAMQNTILKTKEFPIRAIVPGRVFRNEATDARHEAIFTQLEGIVIDKGITVTHLMAVLQMFVKELFGEDVKFRTRPGYFPFVEPGIELDIDCLVCHGSGCGLCKGLGWTEVMPCGMIHPNVLKEAGIDPLEYSGFAFGFGLSRLTQMKYGIEDVRMLFSSDKRFLDQF